MQFIELHVYSTTLIGLLIRWLT